MRLAAKQGCGRRVPQETVGGKSDRNLAKRFVRGDGGGHHVQGRLGGEQILRNPETRTFPTQILPRLQHVLNQTIKLM